MCVCGHLYTFSYICVYSSLCMHICMYNEITVNKTQRQRKKERRETQRSRRKAGNPHPVFCSVVTEGEWNFMGKLFEANYGFLLQCVSRSVTFFLGS